MHVTSIVFEEINNNSFTRTVGNVKLYVDNRGVYRKDINVKFAAIYPYKVSGKVIRMLQPD